MDSTVRTSDDVKIAILSTVFRLPDIAGPIVLGLHTPDQCVLKLLRLQKSARA
jgi:hypothetical protein